MKLGWHKHRLTQRLFFPQNLSISKEKLTYLYITNSGPTTQTQEDGLWVVGPLPVLQTLWDKEPFSRLAGFSK